MQRILLKCTENNGVEKKIIVVIVQKYNKSQKWRLSSILFPPLKQISEQNWFLFLFNEQFSELSIRTFPFCAKLRSLSDLISNKVLHFHFNNNYYFQFSFKNIAISCDDVWILKAVWNDEKLEEWRDKVEEKTLFHFGYLRINLIIQLKLVRSSFRARQNLNPTTLCLPPSK